MFVSIVQATNYPHAPERLPSEQTPWLLLRKKMAHFIFVGGFVSRAEAACLSPPGWTTLSGDIPDVANDGNQRTLALTESCLKSKMDRL